MGNDQVPGYEPPAVSTIGSIEQLTLVEIDQIPNGSKPA